MSDNPTNLEEINCPVCWAGIRLCKRELARETAREIVEIMNYEHENLPEDESSFCNKCFVSHDEDCSFWNCTEDEMRACPYLYEFRINKVKKKYGVEERWKRSGQKKKCIHTYKLIVKMGIPWL